MSNPSHCKDELLCPGGNCIGCKDGYKWCHDARCDPQCTDCMPRVHHDYFTNFIFLLIIIGLFVILGVYILMFGPKTMYSYMPVAPRKDAGTAYNVNNFA